MRTLLIAGITLFLCKSIHAQNQYTEIFKNFYKLEGVWTTNLSGGIIGEEWTKKDENCMQGRVIFVQMGDTLEVETITLVITENGIEYITTENDAQNNKKNIPFKLISHTKGIYVFENKSHNYPKRIVYQFTSRKTIHSYLDNADAKPVKREDYYYRKVK